ncbi:MAG: S1/P1 nuclease [Dechloromonas sp.]|nr:MAG: S1/P1 nuclease [Dechloromonas sp.]
MQRFLIALLGLLCSLPAAAWNGAGHRLVAVIAWQQLSVPTRQFVAHALAAHPDHPRWVEHAGGFGDSAIFAEAATWADSIRNDPRYHDEGRGDATPLLAGRFDSRRHRDWHYVDVDATGHPVKGELDQQIKRLSRLLGQTTEPLEITYALPWLAHLVADIHQPLHVGRTDDDGGTRFAIENPFKRRQPFTTLHAYWDDLPGSSSLRGRRLQREAARLIGERRPPPQGDADLWRLESLRLHAIVYPQQVGSLLPIIDASFQQRAQATAERRLAEAGYRLGHLLEAGLRQQVSRETLKD